MNSISTVNIAGQKIPFWCQYNMTISEACAYFRIGENTMRQIISDHPTADFILHIGTRTLIKKKAFEKFIDETNAL